MDGATASFPLLLRIPGWCSAPSLTVAGKAVEDVTPDQSGFVRVEREWKTGALSRSLSLCVSDSLCDSLTHTLSLNLSDSVCVSQGTLSISRCQRRSLRRSGAHLVTVSRAASLIRRRRGATRTPQATSHSVRCRAAGVCACVCVCVCVMQFPYSFPHSKLTRGHRGQLDLCAADGGRPDWRIWLRN